MSEQVNIGDTVSCRLYGSEVVSCYAASYDNEKHFEVIQCDSQGYYIRIPNYMFITDSVKVDSYNYKNFALDKRYIGDSILYITNMKIRKIVSKLDGKTCEKCLEFFPKAEGNQPDGTMICWVCRKYHTY